MHSSPVGDRIVPALLCCLALPLVARGDGCVIDRLGRYVPEQEQLAFIEWQDGQERLYVGTRTAPTDQPSLWIVPVRSSPDRVQAEPVETAPQVVYYQPIVARAKQTLNEALFLTALLDSGLAPCGLLAFAGCPAGGLPAKGDVREYQRIEKLGMVVVVLTARSAEALDGYLTANGVNTTAANLVALEPYLGHQEEFALVCGWLAAGGQKLAARGVRVDFPTPTIFYPLQPTRVYESEVRTVVYVRGLVQPVADLGVPGAQCQYVRGTVKEINLGYSFAAPRSLGGGYLGLPPPDATLEPLTRVEMTSAPSSWTRDLVLEPGAPAGVEVARLIDTLGLGGLWGASIVLGMLLAVFLRWAVVPREKRRRTDWLWAVAVGATTGLSLWVSTLVFLAWNLRRFNEPESEEGMRPLGRVIVVLGAVGSVSVLLGVTCGLLGPPSSPVGEAVFSMVMFLGAIGFMLLAACVPALLIYLLGRIARVGRWRRVGWFALFMVAHAGLVCLIFFGLLGWLSAYG